MRRCLLLPVALLCLIFSLCACAEGPAAEGPAGLVPSLSWRAPDVLDAAEGFPITRSEEGYALLTVADDGAFLLVPESMPVPDGLPEEVTPLCQPLTDVYLAASAAMDMLVKLDALDAVAYSSLPAEDWTIPEARSAMEAGAIVYAGKYSAPDYERICGGHCGLAIENTMIYHSPEIKEQLERFGVPVLVDHASQEPSPLGRMEWIRVYGLLLDREEEAETVYRKQAEAIRALEASETGKSVAFFYLASNGEVKVRRPDDYIPQLIRLAGGEYVFDSLEETSSLSTMTLSWETFYTLARDADILIYNSTVTETLPDREALLGKNPLLADFAAVKSGEVYCTQENFYQASMELGGLATDLHSVLTGQGEGLTYLDLLE